MRIGWKVPVFLVAAAALAAWLVIDQRRRAPVVELWNRLSGSPVHAEETRPNKDWTRAATDPSKTATPGVIRLADEQIKAIGLKAVAATAQTEPIVLRLHGQTDYDPATLTIVRPQFDCRVEKVLVDLDSVVKVGDPLLEVFSASLAEAKSNFETARSQWIRDKRVLEYKAPLAKSESLARKELIEAENDEAKSQLQMKLAKDKLLVYGMTEKEIAEAQNEDGVRKARMILRSQADGIVVKRSVVRGNYYDSKDELIEIAALDHLWVRGSVSELDADKVEVGQTIRVIFPYSDRTIDDEVEHIDKAIDPETRSAKFRASIPNSGKRFKAGMFVRVLLEVPPRPGHIKIPRGAMITVDRLDFVFVKGPTSNGTTQFNRRNVLVNKETSDWVIVAEPSENHEGLQPGDDVVTNGCLILEQMYEDQLTVEGELPRERPLDDEAFGKPERQTFIRIR